MKSLVGMVITNSAKEKIYKIVKKECFEKAKTVGERIFAEIGTKSESGEWTFKRHKDDLSYFMLHSACGYTDKSLGSVVWSGQLQPFFLLNDDVHGLDQSQVYDALVKDNTDAAVVLAGQVDIGSIRNCAKRLASAHQVFTLGAVATASSPSALAKTDLFGNGNVDNIVCFNVERKIVEKVINFKKCIQFNFHVHDSHYFVEKEMKENKHIMIAFIISRIEVDQCPTGRTLERQAERVILLKYEQREGGIVGYYPRELAKRIKLCEELLSSQPQSHLLARHLNSYNVLFEREKEDKYWSTTVKKEDREVLEKMNRLITQPRENGIKKTAKQGLNEKREDDMVVKFKLVDDDCKTNGLNNKKKSNGVCSETTKSDSTGESENPELNTLLNLMKNNLVTAKHDSDTITLEVNIPCDDSCKNCSSCGRRVNGASVKQEKIEKNFNGARPKDYSKKVVDNHGNKENKDSLPCNGATADQKTNLCWYCGKEPSMKNGIKLSKCGGCRKAWYCNEQCHNSDWEEHGSYCQKIQEKRKKKKEAKKLETK